MALTLDFVIVAEGREPSGFAAFVRLSPDGLRRSANKVSAIWRQGSGNQLELRLWPGARAQCPSGQKRSIESISAIGKS